MDRMLNIEQVAERLGTSPRFVRRLITERRIAFNKIGRHVRFNPADIEAFIHAGRVEPSSDGIKPSDLPRRPQARAGLRRG